MAENTGAGLRRAALEQSGQIVEDAAVMVPIQGRSESRRPIRLGGVLGQATEQCREGACQSLGGGAFIGADGPTQLAYNVAAEKLTSEGLEN